jgi:hypothetical protein
MTRALASATSRTTTKAFVPSILSRRRCSVLQRKCDCGQHSSSGECEGCKKKTLDEQTSGDPLLQRSAVTRRVPSGVPPIVHEVLRSPGQPLDARTRAYFEPRFGQDLSGVRVHSSPQAAKSARAVDAQAYAVGRNVVFGSGQFQPSSEGGKRLLAHELAHVLQQDNRAASGDLRIGPAGDHFEREAEEVAKRSVSGEGLVVGTSFAPHSGTLRRQKNPAPAQPAVPRGTNPSACMATQCAQLAKSGPPGTNSQAGKLADQWLSGVRGCVASGAAGSNASHQAEIAQHELVEMDAEAAELKKSWTSRPKGFANAEFLKWLGDLCKRRQRQVDVEFRYNVLFENPPGGVQWDPSIANWDPIESALAALPDEATWSNPRLLRFHREACHPDDVDAATGSCKGKPAGPLQSSFTAGETKSGTGEITIFNEGIGARPFTRSERLGVSTTAQTIRHEVGHVIGNDLPQDKKTEFFEKVIGWVEYPWAWISIPKPPNENWKAQKDAVKAELGFDDAKLDSWLAGLQVDKPVVVGSRTYVRIPNFLRSVPTAGLPTGVEFEYARTSQNEYFAELYALAVSSPEFLHRTLPYPQIAWLKTELFHTQQAVEEISRQAAVGEPQLSEFLEHARLLFTPQQIRAALNDVLTKPRPRTGTVA